MRLVQKGSKGLAIGWLIGAQCDPDLRKVLPDWSIVMSEQAPVTVTSSDLESARKLAGVDADTPVILVGFSAGCQTVRAAIVSGIVKTLVGCAVFDGTSGQTPAPLPWQILVWAQLSELARQGKFIFVGTCTEMTYTKAIPPGQPGSGWPTRYILETATDFVLEPGSAIQDGTLYLEAFQSSDCDKEAHIRQQREVMPTYLAKAFSGDLPEPFQATVFDPSQDSTIRQGRRAALWTLIETSHNVHEVPDGSNDGSRIKYYFDLDYRRRGPAPEKPIGLDHGEWCAALVCRANADTALPGEAYPAPRVSGIELEEDAKETGSTTDKPMQGDLAIFNRPNGTGWAKHVTRVLHIRGNDLLTIGGNEGNGIKITAHKINEPETFIKVGR